MDDAVIWWRHLSWRISARRNNALPSFSLSLQRPTSASSRLFKGPFKVSFTWTSRWPSQSRFPNKRVRLFQEIRRAALVAERRKGQSQYILSVIMRSFNGNILYVVHKWTNQWQNSKVCWLILLTRFRVLIFYQLLSQVCESECLQLDYKEPRSFSRIHVF